MLWPRSWSFLRSPHLERRFSGSREFARGDDEVGVGRAEFTIFVGGGSLV